MPTAALEPESVLPLVPGPGLPGQITRLMEALRDAPMTDQGKALFDAAAAALAELPDEFESKDLVLCLLYISRRAYYCGHAGDGLPSARQAVGLARRLRDEGTRARALTTLGILYMEAGTYPDSISTLAAALECAQTAGDRFQEVQILTNLGLVHQCASHFGAALPCYERALELAEANGIAASPRAAALGNIVLANLYLHDYRGALVAAERAVQTLAIPENVHQRTVRSCVEGYLARVLMETGDLDRAAQHVQLAREFAAGGGDVVLMSADLVQGLCEVYNPATRDIGLSRLQQCVDRCRMGTPTALREALTMIVRGFEIAGQPNAALVYLHEIVQLNGEKRVRNVITHHHLHLARVRASLDARANTLLEEHQRDLRYKRVPMDVLRDCMVVLEQNTVAAELHDDDTGEHCYRMGALARELALRIGMDAEMATLIDLSARLHDIGKLKVPDSILLKRGRLNPDERLIMQEHCIHGWDVIGEARLGQLFVAQEIALNHHERWDGTGYPNRRAGHLIPLAARITALADVYDALTHRRCYKEAWSAEQALREIHSLRGTQFDPELTDVFLNMIPDLQAQHDDLDAYLGAEARRNDFVVDRARIVQEMQRKPGSGK